jgi:hypothetical protein
MTADRDTTLPTQPEFMRMLDAYERASVRYDNDASEEKYKALDRTRYALRDAWRDALAAREGAERERDEERRCRLTNEHEMRRADAEIAALRSERDALAARVRGMRDAFRDIAANDKTHYDHHEHRPSDGKKPREVGGGSIFLTPKEIAEAALASPAVDAPCPECGGSEMVGTGQPSGEGGEEFDRCPSCALAPVAPEGRETVAESLEYARACTAEAGRLIAEHAKATSTTFIGRAPETPAPSGCVDGPKCCHDECREERYFRAGRAPAKEDAR